MTKRQKVTVAILGPIVIALTLGLIVGWPFFAPHGDDSSKMASGQVTVATSGVVASATAGQGTTIVSSSPGSPAVLTAAMLAPFVWASNPNCAG